MMARSAFAMIVVLTAMVPVGCHKSAGPAAATPAVITDYRTLNMAAIEIIIADKTGSPVTLKQAGPNKYTGTQPVPDGTGQVPLTVTVEAEQIIIESSGGGMSARSVITPRGLQVNDAR
jgi:hypothetical protein